MKKIIQIFIFSIFAPFFLLAKSVDFYPSEVLEFFFDDCSKLSITPLTGGLESPTWKVEGSEETFVLRLLDKQCPLHRVMKEIWATEFASHFGIGPKLINSSIEHRALLIEYVENVKLSECDNHEFLLSQVTKTLSLLHNTIKVQPFSFIETLYNKVQLEDIPVPSALSEAMDRVQMIIREIHEFATIPVFSHGDFHLEQVLVSCDEQEVKFIDWTTACFGDRFFDLAKFTLPFDEKKTEKILVFYLNSTPSEVDKRHFELTQRLVLMTIVLNRLTKSTPEFPLSKEQHKRLVQEMDILLQNGDLMHYLDPYSFSSPETLRESALSALYEFFERDKEDLMSTTFKN